MVNDIFKGLTEDEEDKLLDTVDALHDQMLLYIEQNTEYAKKQGKDIPYQTFANIFILTVLARLIKKLEDDSN